jgi:hypothetical protein
MQIAVAPMPVPVVTMVQSPAVPPQTQIALATNFVAPTPEPVAAPISSNDTPYAPVSAMGELRAEDVVALDMGRPAGSSEAVPAKQETKAPEPAPVATPPVMMNAPEPTKPEISELPKFMAPLPETETVKKETSPAGVEAASADMQFMSPLAEGLPTDEKDQTQNPAPEMIATAPQVLRDPKQDEPKIEAKVDQPKALTISDEEVKATEITTAESLEPQFISPLAEGLPTNETTKVIAATEVKNETPNIPVVPKKIAKKSTGVLADPQPAITTNDIAKDAAKEVANTHASAMHAADAVAESMAAPAMAATATVADVTTKLVDAAEPAKIKTASEPEISELRDQIALSNARVDEANAQIAKLLKEQEANTMTIAANDVKRAEGDDAEKKILAALAEKAAAEKAQQESEQLAKAETEKAQLALAEQAKARAEAEALAQMQAEKAAQAMLEAEKAKQQAALLEQQKQEEIAQAKAQAELAAKAQADEMARQQAAEIARIQAEADAKATALVQTQAEALAKAQLAAEAKAREQAMELAAAEKEKTESSADKEMKITEAKVTEMARQQLAEAKERLANKSRAVPVKPVERTTIVDLPKIIEDVPMREAALSSGAMNDALQDSTIDGTFIQQTLLFQPGISAIPANVSADIQALAQQMKNNRDAKMILNAYADSSVQAGSGARRLSLQRAILVRDALNKMGVPVSRVEVRAQTAAPGEINPDRVDVTLQ